ncbi:GGDEF domain-containing protein [Marinomonas epiphytica]
MLKKIFNQLAWKRFFYAGLPDQTISEDSRRVFMINLFSLVGVVFTLPLGVSSLIEGSWLLGLALVAIAAIYTFNHLYLRKTQNHLYSGGVIIYPLYCLMLGLVYFGGVGGTGPLWIYCVPAVAFFINGLQKGLIEVTIFTFAVIVLMFLPVTISGHFEYSDDYKLRVIFSFLVVTFLSGIYEYSMYIYNSALIKTSEQLIHAAETDSLTGLLNRRGLQTYLNAQEEKGAASLHLLLLDIDHFKAVNDTHGHDVGDLVLQELARMIRSVKECQQGACRWGGEEFLVLLPDMTTSEVYQTAERLRQFVSEQEFFTDKDIFTITISIGLAAVGELTFNEAIKQADLALYQAKDAGRNRSFWA